MLDVRIAPRLFDSQIAKSAFETGAPFKHVVIDDFFDRDDALALHRAFPTFSPAEELKSRLFSGRVYGPPPPDRRAFAQAFSALSAPQFVRTLSEISGIRQLAMDETHAGAGAHIGLNGSSLPTHADHNTHPKAAWLYRRLNLLVYLNPAWEPSWRCNLQLFDRTGTRKIAEIEPRFNRAVLMDVNDIAFHGYSPLQLPAGQTRQMLAMYYYSPERSPDQAVEPHPTIFATPAAGAKDRVIERVRRKVLHYAGVLAPQPQWNVEPSVESAARPQRVSAGGIATGSRR